MLLGPPGCCYPPYPLLPPTLPLAATHPTSCCHPPYPLLKPNLPYAAPTLPFAATHSTPCCQDPLAATHSYQHKDLESMLLQKAAIPKFPRISDRCDMCRANDAICPVSSKGPVHICLQTTGHPCQQHCSDCALTNNLIKAELRRRSHCDRSNVPSSWFQVDRVYCRERTSND